MKDTCPIATEYAVRISKCSSEQDLRFLWEEITRARDTIGQDWYFWLSTIKFGKKEELKPKKSAEDLFNKDGLNAIKRGEITW